MTFVVFVCCVRASNFFYRGGGRNFVCEKKGKKVLHHALEKAIFCSSLKLFFDEKVFKETRTNATLTTTLIKKKRRQRDDDDVFLLLLKRGGGKERRKGVRR